MTFDEWWEVNEKDYSADACHMSEYHMAATVWNAALASRPEERTQEAMTLLREAHMFATAQAFVADDFDAHCDRLAKFLGYTVDTHGPIKEKE